MKKRKNQSVFNIPTDLVDGLEQTLTAIYDLKVPDRLLLLEERMRQLECVEEMAMRVENIENALWTSKEVLTSNEAAVYLGMESSYLYKLTCRRKIPFYKPNDGRIYFKKAELDDWATRRPVANMNGKSNSKGSMP